MAGIINSIITRFSAQGAGDVENASDRVGRSQTRLGQASASAGRQFAAQASGLGGLVAAYAGAAATIFAVSAAFDALSRAAQSTQTLAGLQNLATASGESADALLASVRDITKGQLTIAEAAQQINLSLSAGFDSSQIEGLANVALKASRALGRDLTDAYTRVIRGSAKLETELLDELGIYTKIDPATRAYAAAIGKNVTELTEFERRQAFVNSVIAEGERKFSSINTTIPTAAEKIAAFGTKIQDLTTIMGQLLANTLAPVADFLTNNFAGSLAAVSALLILISKTAVAQLSASLVALEASIARVAQTSSAWVAKSLGDFRQYGAAARTAIGSTSLVMNGLTRANQAELKSLRETAQARKLNNAELRRAQAILTERNTKIGQNVNNMLAQRRALQAVIRDTTTDTATRAAASASLQNLNTRLATNIALLRSTRAQINATTAALGTFSVALSAAAAGAIRLGGAIVTVAVASFARLISIASGIVGIVAIFGLVGSAVANLIGKQEQYNALLENGALALKAFFNPTGVASFESEFTNLAGSAVEQLDTITKGLGDIEEFKIKDKVFGLSVDVTKTKEDLVREVGSIVNEVATATSISFGEALTGEAGRQGGLIGAIFGGIIGSVIPGIGTAIGAAAGIAIGAAVGAAINAALASGSEVEAISEENAVRLGQLIGDNTIAGILESGGNDNLAKALNLLYEQSSVAAELSLEGRRYLRTQVELTKAIIDNVDNIVQLQTAADALGLSVSQLQQKFEVTSDALGNTIVRNIIKGIDTVQVSVVLQNEQEVISQIENIRDLALEMSNPYELDAIESTALGQANVDAGAARNEINFIQADLNRLTSAVSDARAEVQTEIAALQGLDISLGDVDISSAAGIVDLLDTLDSKYEEVTETDRRGRTVVKAGYAEQAAAINQAIDAIGDLISANSRLSNQQGTLNDDLETQNAKLQSAQAIIDSLNAKTGREIYSQEQVAIVDDIVARLGDVVLTLNIANRDLLASNNLLSDLATSADRGALTLETLAQAETSVSRAVTRSTVSLNTAQTELNGLLEAKNMLLQSGVRTDSEIITALEEQISAQETIVANTREDLTNTTRRRDAILDGIAPLRTQLEIAKQIKDNFESELKARQDAIGLFTSAGQLTLTDDQEALARLEYLNNIISDGSDALAQRTQLENRYNELLSDRPALVAEISSITGENAEQLRKEALARAGITEEISNAITALPMLTAVQQAQAKNSEDATSALQGSIIEFTRNVFEATVKAKEAISELKQEITLFRLETEIQAIELRIELDEQGFDAIQNRIENEIESIENKIDLLNQLTDLGNFTPVTTLTEQVRNELGPALEASAKRFAEITGRAASDLNTSIAFPTDIQGLSEADAAKKETELQFDILEKRLQLNDLELERETKRIENERSIMQLEFDLFYAEQQFETQKQQALANLNKAQLQGLAQVYSAALGGQTDVNQQLVSALASVFSQAANQLAAANNVEGFSASIAPPNLAGADVATKLQASLDGAMMAYETSVDEQMVLTQELADARVQAEVEAFANRSALLDGEQTAAEAAHQANISRIIEEGQITAATGANTIREISEAAEKAAKKIPMWTGRYEELASGFKSAFSSAFGSIVDYIMNGGEEGESFGDRLKMAFGKLMSDIATSIIDKAVIEPLSNFLANKLTGFLVNRLPVDIMGDSMAKDVGGDAAVTASNQALTGMGTTISGIGTTVAQQINTTATTIGNALQGLGFGAQQGSGTAAAQLSGAGAQLQGAQSAMGGQVQAGASGASAQITASGVQQATAQTTAGATIGAAGAVASTGIMAALSALWPILLIFGLTALFRKKATGGFVQMALGGAVKQLAAGGMLRDRVPALLEPGEFVIRRPAAKAIGGPVLQQMNATGKAPGGGAPVVNIINQGTPQDAKVDQPRFDGERYIIDIVTKDILNNGQIKKSFRGG